jgi:hypothetical protein
MHHPASVESCGFGVSKEHTPHCPHLKKTNAFKQKVLQLSMNNTLQPRNHTHPLPGHGADKDDSEEFRMLIDTI